MIHGTVARRWSWILLAGLMLALLATTMRSDAVAGEREATFRAAALSLAWDGDLTWARADYDRYVRLFGSEPEAIALESGAGGPRVGFARPPAYMALAAPFVRILPRRGPALLNWLLLALAAAGSALALERRIGPLAPAWIALCVVGTTVFTLLPASSPGTFRLATSALAWALVVDATGGRRPSRGETLRWSLVGFFLALAAVASVDGPCLAPALAAAAWLALRQPRRGSAFLAFTLTAALTAGASLGVSALARGGFAAVERAVFDPSTGFPAVDFEAEEWRRDPASASARPVHRGPDLRAVAGIGPEILLQALAGRTIGIAPYCAPLAWAALGGLFAAGWRRALLLGGLASVAARVAFLPFDLGDESALAGPGGVGAVLPMFWFLAGRLGPARLAAVAVSSALFLHPLWLRPGAAFGPSSAFEGAFHRFLPMEIGQRPRTGEPADLFVGGAWLRTVAGGIAPFGESGLLIEGGSAELLLAWEPEEPGRREANGGPRRSRLRILVEPADAALEIVGGEVEESASLPSGRASVRLLLDSPEARRRMWWSRRSVDVFRLGLTLDGGEDPASIHVLWIGSVP